MATRVTNSRLQKSLNQTWRRRVCSHQHVFTTHESVELRGSIIIQYSAKDMRNFERDRLFVDIYKCLEHRKAALADASALVATIIAKLLPQATNGLLRRSDIVACCAEVLYNFDKTAHALYSAYHRGHN